MLNKKSFYKLFGLLSIFTITTPIITTAVSCSYDWLGAGGPSGGTADGNSRVIENNPEISIKQGKEYIDYEGRFGYEYGEEEKWYKPPINLIPQSFFDEYVDKIKNNQIIWFDDQRNQIQYKITINIDPGFYTAPNSRAKLTEPVNPSGERSVRNIYFKNKSRTILEFILTKWNDPELYFDDSEKWRDFKIEPIGNWTTDRLYKLSLNFSRTSYYFDYYIPVRSQIGGFYKDVWDFVKLISIGYDDKQNNFYLDSYRVDLDYHFGSNTKIKEIFKPNINSNLFLETEQNIKNYGYIAKYMNSYFTNVKGTVTIAKL